MIIKFTKRTTPSIAGSLMIETIRRAVVRNASAVYIVNKRKYYKVAIYGKFTKEQKEEIKKYCY